MIQLIFKMIHEKKYSNLYNERKHENPTSELGYEPKLHRGLDATMNFAFGFTEVAALASIAITLGYGLGTGGPISLFWGFLANFIFTILIVYCMAEICAAYPSAGSVYNWSAQLSPKEWAPLLSYLTGWCNILGNTASDASYASGLASFLSAIIVASGGLELDPNRAQVYVSIGVLISWSIVNFFRIDQVGWISNLAALVHISSVVIIIVALLALSPQFTSAAFVFTHYNNNTGIGGPNSQSFVGVMGITAATFCFVGYEASAHMAEETNHASTAAAGGLIKTVYATGIVGLALILTFCFVSYDLAEILNDDDSYNGPATGNACVNMFILAAGEDWGQAMAWLIVINLYFAGISSVAVTARITFALARDGGFPFSNIVSQVDKYFKSPIYAILFIATFGSCLLLIPLDRENGMIAFTSLIGLCVLGFQISYALPILCKLIFPQPNFPNTPMDLGFWSKPFGIMGVLWLFGTSSLLFFPVEGPLGDVSTMNWLCVVAGGCFIIGAVNWVFNSRYYFKGPVRVEDVKLFVVSSNNNNLLLPHISINENEETNVKLFQIFEIV